MTVGTRATRPGEVHDLGEFLIRGFNVPAPARLFSPEVLRWKYFDPRFAHPEPLSLVAEAGTRMVGHIGLSPREFVVLGAGERKLIPTLHFIDWCGSIEHRGVGALLMMATLGPDSVRYSVGGTPAAQRRLRSAGYMLRHQFPEMVRVVRPWYRVRGSECGPRVLAAMSRDLALLVRARTSRVEVGVRRITTFGHEIEDLVEAYPGHLVFTSRTPALLNHLLRCPAGNVTGWHVYAAGNRIGFALVSVLDRPPRRYGKIVDCFLVTRDLEMWHAAIAALTRELWELGVDVVSTYASSPWMLHACRRAGMSPRRTKMLLVRDGCGHLPADVPFHLMPIEADHAFVV